MTMMNRVTGQKKELPHIRIYTDGACRGNNKEGKQPGGWGYVIIFQDHIKEDKGYFKATTNNVMELMAAIKALRALKRFDLPVDIYSDSQYLVSTMNEHWAKNTNRQYWKELYEQLSKFAEVSFIKVKGHSADTLNARADKLANEALDEYKKIQGGNK